MMKRIISLALVVLMVAALFVGCGSSAPANPEGTYKVKSIDGKSVKDYLKESFEAEDDTDIDSVLSFLGLDNLEDFMTLTLETDGSFSMSFMGGEETGTWKLSGNKLTLTNSDGEEGEATFKSDDIVIDMDGEEMVLGK
ncbi:MAG: lipocalin family protein [Oscillospiraceae bacterium]|nr:lipocalin family protein [Oscillospiraceae bacterium]